MDWEKKYIKYKLKYLNLKKLNEKFILDKQDNLNKQTNLDKQLGGFNNKKWYNVYETWDDYQATLKKMDTVVNDKGKKNSDYIYDIFRGIKEKDFIMCVTKEFIILPSAAKPFDDLDKNHFNLLVYPFDKKLRSIRDLTAKHIPLLKRMIEKVYEVLDYYLGKDNYEKKNITMEFHYSPSSYHLHLHNQLNKESKPNKRHLYHNVYDVIKNLKSDSDYYKKPIKIRVKNIKEWKEMIKKYSIKKGEKFESASGVEDFSEAYKKFMDLDAYKLFNKN